MANRWEHKPWLDEGQGFSSRLGGGVQGDTKATASSREKRNAEIEVKVKKL